MLCVFQFHFYSIWKPLPYFIFEYFIAIYISLEKYIAFGVIKILLSNHASKTETVNTDAGFRTQPLLCNHSRVASTSVKPDQRLDTQPSPPPSSFNHCCALTKWVQHQIWVQSEPSHCSPLKPTFWARLEPLPTPHLPPPLPPPSAHIMSLPLQSPCIFFYRMCLLISWSLNTSCLQGDSHLSKLLSFLPSATFPITFSHPMPIPNSLIYIIEYIMAQPPYSTVVLTL